MYVTQQPLQEVSDDEPKEVDGVVSEDDWIDGMEDERDEDEDETRRQEQDLFGATTDEDEEQPPKPDKKPQLTDPLMGDPGGDERVPRDLHSPVRPSARAIELHNYTHLPYRCWCNPCREARAK